MINGNGRCGPLVKYGLQRSLARRFVRPDCEAFRGNDSHRGTVRESFHSQMLRPPNITKASTLGQSGIGCPATQAPRVVSPRRNNCAKLISPKMMLATRNPRICELCSRPFGCLYSRTCVRRLTTGVPTLPHVGLADPSRRAVLCRFWAPPNDYLVSSQSGVEIEETNLRERF